jgi:hypothetical protein
MKKLLLIFSVTICSCSSPSANQDQLHTHNDTLPPGRDVKEEVIIPDSVAHPSDELKKFLAEVKKMHFVPTDTSHVFFASDHKNYFGLVDAKTAFAAYEDMVMLKARNACMKLRLANKKKEATTVEVEEWIFASEKEAANIEDALTRPLPDKRIERFARSPLTFWRTHERIYYVHAADEKMRPAMENVNNVLVQCLSPEEVL